MTRFSPRVQISRMPLPSTNAVPRRLAASETCFEFFQYPGSVKGAKYFRYSYKNGSELHCAWILCSKSLSSECVFNQSPTPSGTPITAEQNFSCSHHVYVEEPKIFIHRYLLFEFLCCNFGKWESGRSLRHPPLHNAISAKIATTSFSTCYLTFFAHAQYRPC